MKCPICRGEVETFTATRGKEAITTVRCPKCSAAPLDYTEMVRDIFGLAVDRNHSTADELMVNWFIERMPPTANASQRSLSLLWKTLHATRRLVRTSSDHQYVASTMDQLLNALIVELRKLVETEEAR